jgi:hypothetical protein
MKTFFRERPPNRSEKFNRTDLPTPAMYGGALSLFAVRPNYERKGRFAPFLPAFGNFGGARTPAESFSLVCGYPETPVRSAAALHALFRESRTKARREAAMALLHPEKAVAQ